MIRSILMGLVAGMRSMTPIAVISWAARRNLPSSQTPPLSILSSPAVSKVTLALAAAELLGDKMRSAPDRIIVPGILARVATGAIAGAAVAPRQDRPLGAVLGATVAVGAAYLTFRLRKYAIRNGGQTSTGLIEDAVALSAALWVAHAGRPVDLQWRIKRPVLIRMPNAIPIRRR
jgi:uncharacterized membrane protein